MSQHISKRSERLRMPNRADSVTIFKQYFWSWQVLGVGWPDNCQWKPLVRFYDFIVTIMVTICYPLHLILGLLQIQTTQDIFSNLVINVACFMCSLKQVSYRRKLQRMHEITAEYAKLDERVHDEDERQYFRKVTLTNAYRLMKMFAYIYVAVGIFSFLSLLVGREKRLLYPAWFPFDWTASNWHYLAAIVYQGLGLFIQICQNFSNDYYGPMVLCFYAGHVRLLRMRVAKIGYSPDFTEDEHNNQLIACFKDYERLMRIYKLLAETVSIGYMIQFFATGVNICVAVIYIIFYADSILVLIYYGTHLTAMLIELFPGCYYGSLLEIEFRDLPYAIFSTNWLVRGRKFRKHVILFTELSLRVITMYAAGMVRIHVGSFFATCKMAYSFFTLILSMK